MLCERTIHNSVKATGVRLHRGGLVEITLRPAPPRTGIVFRRIDCSPVVEIPARTPFVGDTTLSTSIQKDDVNISTVEHLMSAFAGLGIDNAYVELNADELPVMDGSAGSLIFLIQSAGIATQAAPKRFIRIKRPIQVSVEDKWARLEPHRGFKVDFTIDFKHPIFRGKTQQAVLDFSSTSFIKEISRARTFGFVADIERLRAMNLGRGGSLDNAVVLDEYRILNEEGLRYPNEFVRHKILDAVGDLYMAGHPIIGAFTAYKSGHALNHLLLQTLFERQEAWEFVTFKDATSAPVQFTKPLFEADDVGLATA